MSARFDRRCFCAGLGAAASAFALFGPASARALGRTPLGGRISMHVPFPTSGIDPHDLRDPAAALFAEAIADPVFALDPESSAPYPSLASAMPSREGGETVVRLREGLCSARLVALGGRDLVASVERARSRGAASVLAQVPRPSTIKGDALAARFGPVDPGHLARALASPLVALLPRDFDPGAPDGTGAFRADILPSGILLTRNLAAARGPAFLDSIAIAPAQDLKTSLWSFEAERDDIGWLGLGLHDGRKGAVRFDCGRAAWVVLTTLEGAGAMALPGAAQHLCDAIPPERLAHLGLGSLPPASGDPSWSGPSGELIVDAGAPYLVEVARAVATVLSRPGHEVTVLALSRAEFARRRMHGKAVLAIDMVRSVGPSPLSALLSLATADDPARGRELGRTPPKLSASAVPRKLTRSLRVGVLGEVRIAGGAVADIVFGRPPSGEGWDLGATYRKPPRG